MFASLAKYEWALLEFVVLGVLVWQLVSLRLDRRRTQAAERAAASAREADTQPGS